MSEVTRILEAIDRGETHAAEQLLPLVYDELRRLAAHMMSDERPGQTLQPTALVHEAYLRLVKSELSQARRDDRGRDQTPGSTDCASQGSDDGTSRPSSRQWANRRHFFAAAAEAMRRILVENARRKGRLKRGGNLARQPFYEQQIVVDATMFEDVLAVHEALEALERANSQAAELVKLRYFAGCTIPESAELLGISPRKTNQLWAYARAWLLDRLTQ